MAEPRLFDPDPPQAALVARQVAEHQPTVGRRGQPTTVWDAAVAITASVESIRWAVLDEFARAGAGGRTNLEIEDHLGLRRPTGSNRRLELEQHHLVERRGDDKRALRDSQPAQVYVITPLGQAVHRHHMEEN